MHPPITVGRVVKSKSGRDKGRFFVVYYQNDEKFVYLVDGDLRKLASPKKKKIMHVEPTHTWLDIFRENGTEPVLDAHVRKALQNAGFNKPKMTAAKEG